MDNFYVDYKTGTNNNVVASGTPHATVVHARLTQYSL
jgi:hypothetical protein